jgi:hypothetical protein
MMVVQMVFNLPWFLGLEIFNFDGLRCGGFASRLGEKSKLYQRGRLNRNRGSRPSMNGGSSPDWLHLSSVRLAYKRLLSCLRGFSPLLRSGDRTSLRNLRRRTDQGPIAGSNLDLRDDLALSFRSQPD